MDKYKISKSTIKNVPEDSGVYIFWNKEEPHYVGKAINLKNRVKSYFHSSLSGKTKKMIETSDYISYIKTTSDLEALLLEAKLIKKFSPPYNVELKDDKHPLYIKITNETYPRVITARKADKDIDSKISFGPFPSSRTVYSVLKQLRRSFPYATHKLGKRKCLYSQLGLCDPCPNSIESIKNAKIKSIYKKEYNYNIRMIRGVLTGRITSVRKNMVKKMEKLSKEENYEEAAKVKKQISNLDYITRPTVPASEYIKDPNLKEDIRLNEITQLREIIAKHAWVPQKLQRIECFDIAHLSGIKATASMVTFINGEADKSMYRHFKIRQNKTRSDVDSMREIAIRREKRFADWGMPDLIIVDGGRTQVGVFLSVMRKAGVQVVGIAKREEKLIIPAEHRGVIKFKEMKLPKGGAKNLVQRIRDEAHRFARRYHHKLLQKELTSI